MSKQKIELVRQLTSLSRADKEKIAEASDSDLPKVLEELGISLPSSSWWLVALKIILYGLGLVLAGIGTSSAAQAAQALF